jgi:iron complex outermembrane receptor protein
MFRKIGLVSLLAWAGVVSAQEPVVASVSEKDFLGDMPIVLSVSRLPQRLDETPGAVTILDRDMIRLSGARDVADLLRLVPGFRVTNTFQSNAPQGSYHIGLGDFNFHLQVLVDGRSVYSPFLNGGTGPGLQTVALEDIERIEVHRGSNSAAYGARAFLGTINIVTRSLTETRGTLVSMTGGDNSILDGFVRHGWGDDRASYRLSADQRSDRGLSGTTGPNWVSRLNFRADFNLGGSEVLELRTGQSVVGSEVGMVNDSGGNQPRTRTIDTGYLQLDWKRSLDVDQDMAVQYAFMQEKAIDRFLYPLVVGMEAYYGTPLDAGGQGSSHSLTATHIRRWGPDFRLAWGAELRREGQVSHPKFDTDAELVTEFGRLFANAEWRLRRDLILNAGGTIERSNISGDMLAPRAMLNWQAAPGHTLRYGLSRAHRTPSLFEQYAKVVYRSPVTGVNPITAFAATQTVRPEQIQAREVGYLGYWSAVNAELDVRLFEESITDYIKEQGNTPKFYANREDFKIHGGELQLKLKPWRDGQVALAYSLTDSTRDIDYGHKPVTMASLMVSQRFPGAVDASLVYSKIDEIQFPGVTAVSPPTSRIDLRLAKQLRFGNKRGEIAFVVQNLGPAYQDFLPEFYFRRQAFVMLKLEN